MSSLSPVTRALEAILALPDEAIDLAQAALLIAREEYPHLEVGHYLSVLEGMAATARARLRGGEGPASRIAHLNQLLFGDLGFRGNLEHYDDPRNSFLNDVLDRRVGIPISLSAIYLEVGRRCGVPLAGVPFPGHFLVRYAGPEPIEILIDPFHRGRLLTRDDCRVLLRERFGDRVPFRPEILRRARNREILERMLANLRLVYEKESDFHRALRAQRSLVRLRPDSPVHLRDRGLLHVRVALFQEAADDLDRYLRLAPAASDAAAVRRQTARLRALCPSTN